MAISRIGYQILFGVGIGLGLNQTVLTVQAFVSEEDTPKGLSAVLFVRLLSSALAPPIAQTVFQAQLIKELGPSVTSTIFNKGGATTFLEQLEAAFGKNSLALRKAVQGANSAIVTTFLITTILCAITLPFPLLMEWKSLKKESDKREAAKQSERSEKTVEAAESSTKEVL